MPIVERIAKQAHSACRKQIPLRELEAWGVTGLLIAIDRFIMGGPATLSTYAYYRIKGEIFDNLGAIAPMTRKDYRAARALGDKRAMYRDGTPMEEILDPNETHNPEEQYADLEVYAMMKNAISCLSEKQQYLVREHYFCNRSLKEVGAEIGISKSWASRAHAQAMTLLRAQLIRSDIHSAIAA